MKIVQNLKKIALIALFIFITVLTLAGLTKIMENKESRRRLKGFFTEKEEIDVLLFGSSHIRHGIFPMELFQDYGIVSYNLAGNGDTIPVSYWKLKMALEYQHPKLIIMDVYDLWPNVKTSANGIGQVHTSLDAFPLSYNKFKAAKDLFKTQKEQLEIIWTYSAYHTRWASLAKGDFEVDYTSSLCKGSLPLIAVVNRRVSEDKTADDKLIYDSMSEDYLRRMIELCQDNDIEVLLVNTGYDVNKTSQLFADSAYQIADQYGINYIDFVKEKIINFNTDLYSTGQNTHVNSSGALKLTNYLGNFIVLNYDIQNKRTDIKYNGWVSDYQNYINYKISNICGQTIIENQLMLQADEDFSSCIWVNDINRFIENNRMLDLMQNIAGSSQLQLINLNDSNEEYLLIVDNFTANVNESDKKGINLQTSFGNVVFKTENNTSALFINDMNENRLWGEWYDEDSEVKKPDVQVFVINNYSHEIISSTKWDYANDGILSKRE